MKKTSSAGFSLVELALALLIAGLGVLTVFNLFPQGLDASRKSVDASEISVFGNWVLDSLQCESMALAPSNTWDAQFSNGGTYGKTPLSQALATSGQNPVIAAGTTVQVFSVVPNYYQSLGTDSGYAFSTFTYKLTIGLKGSATKYARLEVWPGDRKGAVDAAGGTLPGSVVFYREYAPRYL